MKVFNKNGVTFSDANSYQNYPSSATRLVYVIKLFLLKPPAAIFIAIAMLSIIGSVAVSALYIHHLEPNTLQHHGKSYGDLLLAIYTSMSAIVVALVGAIVVAYWSADATYGRKWTTIVEHYYEIQEKYLVAERSQERKKELTHPEYLYTQLCVDILMAGLWADPTLKVGFQNLLLTALEDPKLLITDKESHAANLIAGKWRISDAYFLLAEYQDILLEELQALNPDEPRSPEPKRLTMLKRRA